MNIRKFLLILTFVLSCITTTMSNNTQYTSDYDVAQIYEGIELDRDAKAIDSYGNIKDVKILLNPIKLDIGKYEVKLSRVSTNLYKVHGTSIYIETKYCYEYGVQTSAILEITSSYGYTIGKVYFL